ncbi:MAG TPA: protein kinase [Chthoniobacterales bacterium]|nr:protein kinase [Chthoniobacterales bacterium]
MKAGPGLDTPFTILKEPEACGECHVISRLSNGLCLNCLLRGALDDEAAPSGREAFKEALAAVKSQDGDWHIGEHEILGEIARGGMGVIYRAKEPHSERVVALKCVLAYQGDSDQAQARFRREAEMAASLDHPNIIPIYRIGETADGFPFFTMKYATGGSLLRKDRSFMKHPRQGVLLMAKVALAVQYAHEQGVLHRDLKPGNILLDGRGEPLVSDFGLARCEEASSQLTRTLTSFGTPGYIAPEQADGPAGRLTPAADIYSLGAILFELFTGRPPFVGDNALGVMKQSSERPAPKLRTLAPHLDRDLETICARCLERDPSARYRSAGSLAQDLLNWLEDRPIIARPVGPWLRSRRWVRSNRGLVAVLVAFCLLGAGSLVWQLRAQKAQKAMQESVLAARSIAILPFYDINTVTPDEALTKAFSALLEEGLAAFGEARVTTFEAPFVVGREGFGKLIHEGSQNGARAILTGTIRSSQGRKRISFQLVDPATKETLFSHLSDGDDQSALPSAVTRQVSQAIYSVLNTGDWSNLLLAKRDPGLRNQAASEAITAGRLIVPSNTSACDKAIALFEKALEAEPNSSLAHTYIAMAASGRVYYSTDRSFLARAKAAGERALQLAPESSEAHRALAGIYYQEGKFPEALEQALQTVEIGGFHDRLAMFLGMTLDMLGRPHHALRWHQVAAQLTVNPGDVDSLVGDCWTKLVDDQQAERAFARAIELRPNSPEGAVGMAHLRLLEGKFEAAREVCRSLPAAGDGLTEISAQIEFFDRKFDAAIELYRILNRANPNGGGSFHGAMTYCSAAGRAKQALGEMSEAKRLLEECLTRERANAEREPDNPEPVYRLAAVEASLGMTEASLSHLRKAAALGWVDYRSLALDPRFDSLHGPEFQAIIDELSARVAEMRKQAAPRR